MPTLDAALLCSSRAGSDLGRESGLVGRALSLGFLHIQVEVDASLKARQGVFLLLSNQYCNPKRGFEPETEGTLST